MGSLTRTSSGSGKEAEDEHTIKHMEQVVTMIKPEMDAGTKKRVHVEGKSRGTWFDVRKMNLGTFAVPDAAR